MKITRSGILRSTDSRAASSSSSSSGPSPGWESLFWFGTKGDRGLVANRSVARGPVGRRGAGSPGQRPFPGGCLTVAPTGGMPGRDKFGLGYFLFFWCLFLLHCRFLSEFPLSLSLSHPAVHLPCPPRGRGETAVRTPDGSSVSARGTAKESRKNLIFCHPTTPRPLGLVPQPQRAWWG